MAYTYAAKPNRRLAWLNALLVVFGIVMVSRLFQLQVLEHAKYTSSAATAQSRKFAVPAQRGSIYIKDGDSKTPLALNQTLKTLYADPKAIKDKDAVATQLAGVTGDNASDYRAKLAKSTDYIVLKDHMPIEMGDKLVSLNLEGVGVTDQTYRVYPEGQLASQLLGFVNSDGRGQYGLEGYLNQELSGTPGLLKIKTDTAGNPIAIANNVEQAAVDGESYVLTIDRNVQAQAEKYLAVGVKAVGAPSGSVIIMDPSNGQIKAMANYPTYDPNNYSSQTDYSVFSNNVVSSDFEPGSGFKVITMAAGLDTGKVAPDTHFNDTGSFEQDGYTIKNASDHKFGDQTMTDVIKNSINTGVIFVLRMLGGDPNNITLAGKKVLYDYIKRFGFGVATGVEQTGESVGAVNAPSSVSGNNVNYANMTFGQGISVTMVQMITAVAAIANGGKLYQPQLVQQVINGGKTTDIAPKLVNKQVISADAAAKLSQMMIKVVEGGSGYATRMKGYSIAGKTGTAQIPKPGGGGYEEDKNIGSFVGFAPVGHPKFIMMVRVNEPKISGNGFAESTTVPIFAGIAAWLLHYYQIPPS